MDIKEGERMSNRDSKFRQCRKKSLKEPRNTLTCKQ